MASASAHGITAVTVRGVDAAGPFLVGSAAPAGASSVIATAAVDARSYTAARARGLAAAAVAADGAFAVGAAAAGASAVSVGIIVAWAAAATGAGSTAVAVLYAPDLFGDGDAGAYDPNAAVPAPLAPPVQLGLDLRGACAVTPPPLVF